LSELGQRLDALYVAVRDSATVDRQVAFDAAMSELESRPLHAEVRALAEFAVPWRAACVAARCPA
jgi:hypothetical protein